MAKMDRRATASNQPRRTALSVERFYAAFCRFLRNTWAMKPSCICIADGFLCNNWPLKEVNYSQQSVP